MTEITETSRSYLINGRWMVIPELLVRLDLNLAENKLPPREPLSDRWKSKSFERLWHRNQLIPKCHYHSSCRQIEHLRCIYRQSPSPARFWTSMIDNFHLSLLHRTPAAQPAPCCNNMLQHPVFYDRSLLFIDVELLFWLITLQWIKTYARPCPSPCRRRGPARTVEWTSSSVRWSFSGSVATRAPTMRTRGLPGSGICNKPRHV